MSKTSLLRQSLIYYAGRAASRSVSFLLLPIYTAFILPADWGILNILFVTADLIGIAVTFQLPAAMYRFWAAMPGEPERRRLAGMAFTAPLLFSSILFLPCYIWADGCAGLLGIGGHATFVRIVLATQQFAIAVEIMQAEMRLRDQAGRYAIFETVQNFLIAGFSIFFVAGLHLNALGVLAGQLAAFAAIFLIMAPPFLRRIDWRWDLGRLGIICAFAIPLIPSALAMAAVHNVDRYFIQFMLGTDVVGIYSIGHRFGTMITLMFLSPFLLIWDPKSYELAKRDNAQVLFGRIATGVVAILLFMALGLMGSAKELVTILTAPAYHSAAAVIPILVAAYAVYALDPLLRFGLLLQQKTRVVLGIVLVSCSVTVAGNLLLIPLLGMTGPAWATLASFVCLVSLDYALARKSFRYVFEWRKLAIMGTIFTIVLIASSFVHLQNPWAALGVKCAIFLLFPAALFVSGIFAQELATGLGMLRGIFTRHTVQEHAA